MISVIILTHNSMATIQRTIESAKRVSDDIHVVDSLSTDETLGFVKGLGVNVVTHPFEHYGAQRNWAIDNLPLRYDWELHLDADERLTDALISEINQLKKSFPEDIAGYFVPRLLHFLEHPIRHGGMFPTWHMRLFRHGKGRCEIQLYDQRFFAEGKVQKLKNHMIDDVRMPLSVWTKRHTIWAHAEAKETLNPTKTNLIVGRFFGNPVERKRCLIGFYNRAPLFVRPFLLFFYRYFLRLGFLDGKPGLIFFFLQTLWFRFLVDASIYELRHRETNGEGCRPDENDFD